jgi:hypothetical protein
VADLNYTRSYEDYGHSNCVFSSDQAEPRQAPDEDESGRVPPIAARFAILYLLLCIPVWLFAFTPFERSVILMRAAAAVGAFCGGPAIVTGIVCLLAWSTRNASRIFGWLMVVDAIVFVWANDPHAVKSVFGPPKDWAFSTLALIFVALQIMAVFSVSRWGIKVLKVIREQRFSDREKPLAP